MPDHKTKGGEIKCKINNTQKQLILERISTSVHELHDKLITFGYTVAQNANSNEEAAEQLCAVGEVVYDGLKNDNDIMKQYQDKLLEYSDESLILDILRCLNYGAIVSTNEENPHKLDSGEILRIIKQTYADYDIHEYI